ncbi:hypothetical protein GCM10007096_37310 [Pullulanibacillus pueri]|uniref:Uncharacterized protein n=1 Tax=Pullulanibacillus pueri TaxID=1437324 RepID=A0A8J2ZYX3_9BACL|nr:hypothetical protein GCM10007096_37310 [Pullulanibacillus pueri]
MSQRKIRPKTEAIPDAGTFKKFQKQIIVKKESMKGKRIINRNKVFEKSWFSKAGLSRLFFITSEFIT